MSGCLRRRQRQVTHLKLDCHSQFLQPPKQTRRHTLQLSSAVFRGGSSGLGAEVIPDRRNTTSAPTSASFPMLVPLATKSRSLQTPLSLCSLRSGHLLGRTQSSKQSLTSNVLVAFLLDKTLHVSGRSNHIFAMQHQVTCHCK